MSGRKATQHEVDCANVRDYIINTMPQTRRDLDALEAFSRIVRRATRTSVKGKDYVLHVLEGEPFARVYCGRHRDKVNAVPKKEALKDLDSEQWCQRCVARIKKEQTLP